MIKTFNLYCDESCHLENDNMPYMIYGYVSIASNQIQLAKKQIKQIQLDYNFDGEMKWNNVCSKTFPFYSEIINYFFSNDMLFRAVVVDKNQIDNNRPLYSFNDFYFRMYYQLLHHKTDMENTYNVYIDIKDTRSQGKLHELKKILKYNSSINNFQFINSKESIFVQLADLLMGAINYQLRIEKGNLEGKVEAKLKIIEKIKSHTQLTLNKSTSKDFHKFNLFFICLK
ncbi:MAG: DUF3800 domain-containing protein [Bacteroidales bacterium]|nr:DUF3800 domain-containing protein [Bacteroidales bacterium]